MNKKYLTLIILMGLILIYLYFSLYTDMFENNEVMHNLVLVLIIIIGLYILSIIKGREKVKNIKSRDKLFNSLVENSDTVYILINSKNKKVLYLSENIEEILGIKTNNKSKEELVSQLFNIPIIKSELNNWNNSSNYVSQMFIYDTPKYNHQMWLRIKIFTFKEKNEEYCVIRVTDATKEHERQHLLISQATNIKARESQLNQITSSSYDMELNINIMSNTFDLKYFKLDNLYFGEEKRGKYTEGLQKILTFINESDRDLVYSNFSIENLKNHFSKYELDPIMVRYRLGSEVKNNTWLESTIFFLSSKQKSQVSILTKNVTEDAQSIREQNVMLQNALNELKIADKSKTELISTISHDIRTPLTNIMGISESVLNKDISDDIKSDIENIKGSSNEMLDIIDELLNPTKIEKKIIKKEEKEYSILKTFNKIEMTAKEYIGSKPIKINLNLDNNLPVILFGDYKRITQAINKIVNNSIKYTDEGEININVRGEKQENNVKLIVEVSDTGSGIAEEKLNTIMESSDNSTGLGSVKNLMELLDGTLEIESKVGEYTKVTISFIQKIVEDNKVREMMNNNREAEEFSLNGKRILIVDDNKLNLKVTSRLLEPFEVDVTLLQSGQECIEKVKEQDNFDLIMLDQMMPGMDGIETLNKLKEIENFDTPVIVLTADAMDGQKEKYLSSGFSDYISKPIDKKDLSRVLKKFLKKD